MQNLDQAIRERAYHLWVAAGASDGNADAFWLEAQREVLAASIETAIASVMTKASTKSKPAKTAKAKRRAA